LDPCTPKSFKKLSHWGKKGRAEKRRSWEKKEEALTIRIIPKA